MFIACLKQHIREKWVISSYYNPFYYDVIVHKHVVLLTQKKLEIENAERT